MTEPVSICLPCGLCCNGVLFRHVDVMAEEVQGLEQLGLVLSQEYRHFAFRLPCTRHVHSACAIYADRPFTCTAFSCELLHRAQNGTLELDACLEIIHLVRERLARVEEKIGPRRPGQRVWEAVDESLSRLEQERDWSRRDELARDAAELRRFCEEYFGPVEQ